MTPDVTSEFATIEPKLKEILYRCLEEIRATKAALYLGNSETTYTLVTYYGFREIERRQVDARDDLIDRLIVKRTPFFVNSITEEPRFSQSMFASGTTRMLLAPIYSRGRLIGFLDLRDKAAQQPFNVTDVADVQAIIDQFLDFFAERGLFGLKASPGDNARVSLSPLAQPNNALNSVDEARRAVARGILRPRPAGSGLTEDQLEAGAAILPAALSLPGAEIAALSSFGQNTGCRQIAARADLTVDANEKLEEKLVAWLRKRGEPETITASSTHFPLGKAATSIDANRLGAILSASVKLGSMRGVVLTAGFAGQPTVQTRGLLAGILNQCTQILTHAIEHDGIALMKTRVAEKLLEPDFQRFPLLAAHCRRISELASRLAGFAGLTAAEIEQARLAGLVHDVGMRLLDYHNLYRKTTLSAEDLKILREHPIVGAALVADTALGPEIANIVLCHHERPDGGGYPNGLSGEAIPIVSRVLHVCEAFDAMTATDSYQTAVPVPAALSRIRRVAGAQLDEDLANKFIEMQTSQPRLP